MGGITAAFYGWLPLYLPELFPTRVRATGQGLCFNIGRVLAALGTLYLGQLVGYYGGDWRAAMGTITLVYIAGMVLIWFCAGDEGKAVARVGRMIEEARRELLPPLDVLRPGIDGLGRLVAMV